MNDTIYNHPNYNLWTADGKTKIYPTINIHETYLPFLEYPTLYLVSNFGRIFSIRHNQYLSPSFNKHGYLQVTLYPETGLKKYYRVHRMVMMTFAYRPDYKELQVNHLNGHKAWNVYCPGHKDHNLEWVTCAENIQHAIQTGLVPLGEDRHDSKHTNEQIEEICTLLEEFPDISPKELACLLDIPYNENFRGLVKSIKYNKTWRSISCNYNIKQNPKITRFDDNIKHQICELLEQHKYTVKEIAEILNLEYNQNLANTISQVKHRNLWSNISSQYNI